MVGAKNLLPLQQHFVANLNMVGIFPPFLWIAFNVFRDFQITFFIADNVFMIVALPNLINIHLFAKPLGNSYFKSPYN